MKNKLIVGTLSGLLILGGAVGVGASKNDTRVEDSIHKEDKNSTTRDDAKAVDSAHQNRHSGDDDNKIDDGALQNRHSGHDDNKADDRTHQNRHSGHDDNKADDRTHQDKHNGEDDTKADDDK